MRRVGCRTADGSLPYYGFVRNGFFRTFVLLCAACPRPGFEAKKNIDDTFKEKEDN